MSNQINVGLIGAGSGAHVFHIPVIRSVPELRLKTVVDRHGDRSYGPGVVVVRDAAALVEDDAIELVVIALRRLPCRHGN
ncbi:MAG: Gfo/Idh/MocA family oxidoreductase [Verrucomicrobiota bacterium]